MQVFHYRPCKALTAPSLTDKTFLTYQTLISKGLTSYLGWTPIFDTHAITSYNIYLATSYAGAGRRQDSGAGSCNLGLKTSGSMLLRGVPFGQKSPASCKKELITWEPTGKESRVTSFDRGQFLCRVTGSSIVYRLQKLNRALVDWIALSTTFTCKY